MSSSETGKNGISRDLLALERTFLAWIRTATALIGLGFILERIGFIFAGLEGMPLSSRLTGQMLARSYAEFTTLGLVLVVLGIFIAVYSAFSFKRMVGRVQAGIYSPSKVMVIILGVSVAICGVLAAVFFLL